MKLEFLRSNVLKWGEVCVGSQLFTSSENVKMDDTEV